MTRDRLSVPDKKQTHEQCDQCGQMGLTFLISNGWNSWRRCRTCLTMFRDLLSKALKSS